MSKIKRMRVAFQGELGAFSQQAIRQFLGARAEPIPHERFDLVFSALPGVDTAALRASRPSAAREPPEIVIARSVSREAPVTRLSSLVMRAKLYGFQFDLNDGALQRLRLQEEE